ncbi:hypothetical protein [Alkalicoccobacillus gibsonii]|uniref:hypothetical protein n=1 Tax=Alkalicoccobacillus gibsonii TaxID=79881 RepID=UPI001934289F|nr:hypothetical protein [Alkalicoccobacillus gibsonii]MBM0067107.1 hypothetical protein [Alkalicoccobacillus gibsonii]
MKRLTRILLSIILFSSLSSPLQAVASGFELMEVFSLRVTVVEGGIEHEWEYDSPNQYEYETGHTVIKGNEAKIKVDQMVQTLQIDKDRTKEQYKAILEQTFPKLESFDIRFIDETDHLYTWGWYKS